MLTIKNRRIFLAAICTIYSVAVSQSFASAQTTSQLIVQKHSLEDGIAQIPLRRSEIDRRVKELLGVGKITVADAATFTRVLDKIEAREAALRANSGKIAPEESASIIAELEQLHESLNRYQSIYVSNSRCIDLERRINEALNSGRMETVAAKELRADLLRVNQLEAEYKASDNSISDQEALELSREFDVVSSRIEKALPPLPDIRVKTTDIQARIDDAAKNGTIAQDQKRDFNSEIARIKDVESAFRSSDSSLSDWETATVANDLDKLDNEISKAINASVQASKKKPVRNNGTAKSAEK